METAYRLFAEALFGGAALGGTEIFFFFENFEPGLGSGKLGAILGAIAFPLICWFAQ